MEIKDQKRNLGKNITSIDKKTTILEISNKNEEEYNEISNEQAEL